MAEVAGLSITLDANVAPSEAALQSFGNTAAKVFGGVDASLQSVTNTFDNATKEISKTVTASASNLNILSASFESVEKDVFAAADAFNAKWNPILEAAQKEANQTGVAVRNLSQEIKDFANKGIANIDAIKERFGALTPQFAKVSDGSKMFVNGLGKLTAGSKEAGFALQSIGRVISDLPFGPGGIANNLEILPTAFRSVSLAAKESGQTIGSILLKSLAGPGGLILAFSAVSAGLSLATFGLSAWTRLFGGNKKAVDDSTEALKKYREKLDDIDTSERRSAQTQIAKLNVLTVIAQDATATYATRKRAVEDLQKTYPGYFANLTTEKALNADLTKNINEVTQALLNRAAAQAAEKKFAEASEKVYDLQLKQREALKQSNAAADNLDRTYKRVNSSAALAAKESTAFILQNAAANAKTAKNSLDNANKSLGEARKEQLGFLNDAKESAKAAGDLIVSKPKISTAKTQEEKISDVLDKLKADRQDLSRNPLIGDLDKPEKDIQLIEDAIKRLLELKVPEGSTIIQKLIGEEDFGKLAEANIRKNAAKFSTSEPIPVPVEIKPTFSITKLADVQKDATDLIKKNFLSKSGEDVFSNQKIKTSVDLLNSDEISKNFDRLKEQLKTLGDFIVTNVGGAFNTVFEDVLGNGANAFEAFGQIIKKLVVQLISAAATAAILSALLGGTTIGASLFTGGANFKNIFGSITGIKLAKGGIASGPTTALIGEYPGAKSNPEVVAPLNKLQSMLDFNGGSQVFIPDVTLSGPDLVIAFRRAEKLMGR